MTPIDFTKRYWKDAKDSEIKTQVPALFTLSQAALESGWGEHAPGNMFFGIKDTDGINGNEQLITTTEYLKNPDAKFPRIISKVLDPIKGLYKYTVQTYFRKYNTAEESFEDHAKFFIQNARYHNSFSICKNNPYCFAEEVSKAGYATGPNYASTLKLIILKIETIAKNEGFIQNTKI